MSRLPSRLLGLAGALLLPSGAVLVVLSVSFDTAGYGVLAIFISLILLVSAHHLQRKQQPHGILANAPGTQPAQPALLLSLSHGFYGFISGLWLVVSMVVVSPLAAGVAQQAALDSPSSAVVAIGSALVVSLPPLLDLLRPAGLFLTPERLIFRSHLLGRLSVPWTGLRWGSDREWLTTVDVALSAAQGGPIETWLADVVAARLGDDLAATTVTVVFDPHRAERTLLRRLTSPLSRDRLELNSRQIGVRIEVLAAVLTLYANAPEHRAALGSWVELQRLGSFIGDRLRDPSRPQRSQLSG